MASSPSLPNWLEPNLARAAALMNDAAPATVAPSEPLYLGIDLGTSDVVTMAVDAQGTPVAVCLEWADVVRDGVVLAFFEAVQIVKKQVAAIEAKLGRRFTHAATSFPPGTDPRISANVIEAAGLQVKNIVKTMVFVKDLNDFATINAVYEAFFTEHNAAFPARSCVEVARLPKDAGIEIEAIAVA